MAGLFHRVKTKFVDLVDDSHLSMQSASSGMTLAQMLAEISTAGLVANPQPKKKGTKRKAQACHIICHP